MDVHIDYCCVRCNNNVKEEETTRCKTCNIALKLTKCKKQWYVKALAIQDDLGAFLVFHHESVLKVLLLSGAEGEPLELSKDVNTEVSFPRNLHIHKQDKSCAKCGPYLDYYV